MRNLYLTLLVWIHNFLWLLRLRQKPQLGIVYDSVTKQPVDPVVVKLIELRSSKVVASSIANMQGEYGFMANPGTYQIYAQRTNYRFPSERVRTNKDGIYDPVYHGEPFELVGDKDVISLHIPLDPIGEDWNQQAKQSRVYTHPLAYDFFTKLAAVLYWGTFILIAVEFWFVRSLVWQWLLYGYGIVLLLALVTPELRMWGRVLKRSSGQPVTDAIVEVSHLHLPEVVIAKSTTVAEGKFFIRLVPGAYTVVVRQPDEAVNGAQEPQRLTVQIGAAGVLNQDLRV